MLSKKNTKANWKEWINIIFVIFTFILAMRLCSLVELIHIDDIMYAEWTKNGIGYFLEKNIWHYNNYNGRAFVHLCLQIVLMFNETVYPFIVPLFLIIGFYLMMKIIMPNLSKKNILLATSIATMFFLSLGAKYLESTILWMSGAFNYIFPFFVVAIAYTLFTTNKENEKVSWVTVIILFLSGATTEQYGMITIGFIVMTLFFDLLDKKKIKKNILRYLLPAITGCMTVILAPGTFNRIFKLNDYLETNKNTFSDKFFGNSEMLFGVYGNIYIVILFFLIIGIVSIKKNDKYSKLCITAIPTAIVTLILHFTVFKNIKFIICTLELLCLCFALCKKKETREQGKFLICAVGSFLMMGITMNYGTRTCMPFILLIIILSISILYDIAKKHKKFTAYICFLLIFFVCHFSFYETTFNNTKKANKFCVSVEKQLTEAKNTKNIEFDFDETLSSSKYKYRYTTLLEVYTDDELQRYQNLFKFPNDIKVKFKSKEYEVSSLCNNKGEYCWQPVITTNNGVYVSGKTLYLLNGKMKTEGGLPHFYYKNNIYEYNEDTLIIKNKNDKIIYEQDVDTFEISQYAGPSTYFKIEDFCKWTNTKYNYNKIENTYILEELTN